MLNFKFPFQKLADVLLNSVLLRNFKSLKICHLIAKNSWAKA